MQTLLGGQTLQASPESPQAALELLATEAGIHAPSVMQPLQVGAGGGHPKLIRHKEATMTARTMTSKPMTQRCCAKPCTSIRETRRLWCFLGASLPPDDQTFRLEQPMPMRLSTVVLTLSAVGCGSPPSGTCNGVWGAERFESAALDATSSVTVIRPATCAEAERTVYAISWGGKRAQLNASYRVGGPTTLAEKTYEIPLPAVHTFESFEVQPSTPEPKGTLTLGITGIESRRTGTLTLSSGTDSVVCNFGLDPVIEGRSPRCGSGGDADFD